jgi:hypothetical protein
MKFLHYPSFNLLCRFSILGLFLVVSACAPLEKISSDEVALLPPSSLTCWVAAQAPGARTVISDPEFGQGVMVRVEDAYSSAFGLQCKRARITVNGPPGEPVSVCEVDGKGWFMAPRIWGGSSAKGRGL